MCGVSVFYLIFSLDLADPVVTLRSVSFLELAERGVIVCAFTFPYLLEHRVLISFPSQVCWSWLILVFVSVPSLYSWS